MIIHKPERFEPQNAREIRDAVKEAFPKDDKLRVADIVFERAPEQPGGEVGIIVQSSRRIGVDFAIMGEYFELAAVEGWISDDSLKVELDRFRKRMRDEVSCREEDPSGFLAKEALDSLKNAPRTRLGSLMVRDRKAMTRNRERLGNKQTPMMPGEFLRQRGWLRYLDIEANEEARHRHEAGVKPWEIGDRGIRYFSPLSEVRCEEREALGFQLFSEAKKVGGFEEFMKLIDENRVP